MSQQSSSQHNDRLMALVLDPDNPGQLMNIYIDECLYFDVIDQKIVYYHQNGKAYQTASFLQDSDEYPSLYRMGFRRTDQQNFVNIHKVEKVDEKRGHVWFRGSSKRRASVARIYSPFFRQELQQIRD